MAQVAEAPFRPVETASDGMAGTIGGPVVGAPVPIASAPLQRIAVDAVVRAERSVPTRAIIHSILLLGAVVTAFPFYWMVATSFKDNSEAIASPPTFYPHAIHPENYALAWAAAPFARYFFNTAVVAVCWVVGVLVVSSLAAYAFARMEFVGKHIVFAVLLATM